MLFQTTILGINKKNMLQEIVAEMWVEALLLHDRDAFLSDWALSSRWGDEDTADGDELVERAKACGHVWDVANMGLREIREAAGLTQAMLSKRLAIPLSTIRKRRLPGLCEVHDRFAHRCYQSRRLIQLE